MSALQKETGMRIMETPLEELLDLIKREDWDHLQECMRSCETISPVALREIRHKILEWRILHSCLEENLKAAIDLLNQDDVDISAGR